MIIDIQTQDAAAAAVEFAEQFVTVQDLDLMYVSGGGTSGTLL